MRMYRFTLPLALGLSAAAALPALAGGYDPAPAEPVITPMAPAPAPLGGDWGGFYAGVQLGYADVNPSGGVQGGDGETYGLHAGYRWDMGSVVYGIELDYDQADIRIAGGAQKLRDVARLKGQVGYDMGSTLLYGTLGVANADTTLGDETGWLAGAGIAYQVTPAWTVGAEALYHDFDQFGSSGVGAKATTLSLRASFRF